MPDSLQRTVLLQVKGVRHVNTQLPMIGDVNDITRLY